MEAKHTHTHMHTYKIEWIDKTPRQVVKANLNRQKHTKKHLEKEKKRRGNKQKSAITPIMKPINENKH